MTLYCVYLTIYRGNKNKMPPFYIGSSSVEKVQNGYHGSVSSKKWKETWESEIKDNPHLFESKIICTHETRQEAIDKEYKFHKQLNVVKNPLYINQAMAKKNGHFGRDVSGELHPRFGVTVIVTEATRKKQSSSRTGKKHSAETRKSISISNTGKKHSEETRKTMSLNHADITGEKHSFYGKIRITNGVINSAINKDEIIPDGWYRGMRIFNK